MRSMLLKVSTSDPGRDTEGDRSTAQTEEPREDAEIFVTKQQEEIANLLSVPVSSKEIYGF